MFSSVQHTALIISPEKNLWFYELLEFKVCFRKERKYDTAVLMVGHGMELEIFVDSRHPLRASSSIDGPYGLRHFALSPALGWTLEQEVEQLKGLTTEVLEIGPIVQDWTGIRFLFIRDPNGISVEIRK